MLTIFGATHTLTQEMMVLFAALAAFLLGIVTIAVDVVRRNRRRIEAESRPIDTSMFQHLHGDAAPAPAVAGETPEVQDGPTDEILSPETAAPAEALPEEALLPASPGIAAENFVAEEPSTTEPAAALTAQPVLVCDSFGAGFGAKIVLADVSLTVLDQGITTLMGPTGTGKSTLLRALAGMLSQSGLFKSWGAAYFRGAPVGPDNRPLLVAQRIQLIQRSALENLTFHLRDRTAGLPEEKQRKWASQWLEQAGAGEVIALLDRPFMELDQLSQRIITILREAAAEPALLLIDEPTTGLSETDATVLLTMLERLAGFTPLLVSLQNHKHARKISDQIILLAGGQVQAACAADIFFDAPPNPVVAQFIATGACAVPPPDAAAIKPPADPANPPPLTAAALEAIKDEIRSALAVEMTPDPEPEAEEPAPADPATALAAEAPEAESAPAAPVDELLSEPEAVAEEPEAEPVWAEPLEEHLFAPAAHEPEPAAEAVEDHLPAPVAHEPEPTTADVELAAEDAEPVLTGPAEEHPPEPVTYEPEPAAEEAEPVLAEPVEEHLPESVAYEPEPAAPAIEPAAEEPELISAEPVEEHLLEPMAYEPEPAATEIEPVAEDPELISAEPVEEHLLEPLAYEPEPAATAIEPVAEDPEAGLLSAEPVEEHLPEPVAHEPEPATTEFEPVAEVAEAEPLEEHLPEPAATEFELTAEELEAEPVLAAPVEDHLPEPVAYEPEPAAAEPETDETEPVAERMSVPLAYTPGAARPAVIDMDGSFDAAPVLRSTPAEPPGFDPSAFDDLPPISLGPQMMQTVPLPPRAAASQMAPLDPQRAERAAVTRYPGSSSGAAPGPRGFVWIEEGRLAATPMPGITVSMDQDLDMLKQAGITVLITLTEQDFPQTILARHGLRNLHFPIADRKAPSTADTDVLVNQMHELLNRGEVLAVHCLAGLGRTGTILAAYMVKEKGVSAQVALNQIRHFNRQFVQTDDQEDFLMEYEVQQEQTVLRNRATEGGKFLN